MVWFLAFDALEASAWAALGSFLDEGERRRAAGFYFERDRRAYIAAHGIGRALLGLRGGLNPRSSRFKILAHGKPELIVPDGAVP
ncbi:MAG: phosphopantetheinyl transferase, partial [Pseudomonadota bacterium]